MTLTIGNNPAPSSGNYRRQGRFQIEAACRFWWSDISGEVSFACGRTHNLSSGGACVIAKVLPPIGAVVMLEIDLPRADKHDGQSLAVLLLSAEGTIVRHCTRESQFVAIITHATFDNEALASASELLGHVDVPN